MILVQHNLTEKHHLAGKQWEFEQAVADSSSICLCIVTHSDKNIIYVEYATDLQDSIPLRLSCTDPYFVPHIRCIKYSSIHLIMSH